MTTDYKILVPTRQNNVHPKALCHRAGEHLVLFITLASLLAPVFHCKDKEGAGGYGDLVTCNDVSSHCVSTCPRCLKFFQDS